MRHIAEESKRFKKGRKKSEKPLTEGCCLAIITNVAAATAGNKLGMAR